MPDGREWIYNKIRALVFISSVKDCLLLFLVSRWWDPHSFYNWFSSSAFFDFLVPPNFHGPTGHYIATDNYIVFRGPMILKEIYERGGLHSINYFNSRCPRCEEGRRLPTLFVSLMRAHTLSVFRPFEGKKKKISNEKEKYPERYLHEILSPEKLGYSMVLPSSWLKLIQMKNV